MLNRGCGGDDILCLISNKLDGVCQCPTTMYKQVYRDVSGHNRTTCICEFPRLIHVHIPITRVSVKYHELWHKWVWYFVHIPITRVSVQYHELLHKWVWYFVHIPITRVSVQYHELLHKWVWYFQVEGK